MHTGFVHTGAISVPAQMLLYYLAKLLTAYLWHIHIIHEHKETFPHGRAKIVFSSFFYICLQVSLNVHGCCTRREVNYQHQLQTGGDYKNGFLFFFH